MFNSKLKAQKEELEKEVRFLKAKLEDESELDSLRHSIRTLKNELAEVKQKKKMEEEDIKHMVKIHKERNEIQLEKKTMELERAKQTEIAEVKDSYRDKTETQLKSESNNMKEMYGQILERLPNLSAKLTGKM